MPYVESGGIYSYLYVLKGKQARSSSSSLLREVGLPCLADVIRDFYSLVNSQTPGVGCYFRTSFCLMSAVEVRTVGCTETSYVMASCPRDPQNSLAVARLPTECSSHFRHKFPGKHGRVWQPKNTSSTCLSVRDTTADCTRRRFGVVVSSQVSHED
jgi:hypothetical protein